MGFELSDGTLYIMESNGKRSKLCDISNGLVEIDTLSADETPNMSYNLSKNMSASLYASACNLNWFDEFTVEQPIQRMKTFNIEHNVQILTQARWHKKKRINKKWLKRYGMKPDTVKIMAVARTLSYNTETGDCEFEVDKLEYVWRPDQKRKHLKIEM